MKTIYNDADKWNEQFHKVSDDERYDLVIGTLKAPLAESFVEDLDLGAVLVEMLGAFESEKDFDKILNLAEVCSSFQPILYKKEHFYFDEFLINWHLFHQDTEKLTGPLDRFKENPVKGIESMIRALKSLLFYGYTDIVVSLAEKTSGPVEESPELVSGAGYELDAVRYNKYLEQYYKQYLDTHEFNCKQFAQEINDISFEFSSHTMDLIEKSIIGGQDQEVAEVLRQDFSKNRHGCTVYVGGCFQKYMYHKNRMSFTCSGILWHGMVNYWNECAESKTADFIAYFSLDSDSFDKYLVGVMGGFIPLNTADAVAILWGAYYVYDFLMSAGIIKEHIHAEFIRSIYLLKARMVRVVTNDLWKFNFVHRWGLPEGVTEEACCAEEEIFVKSLHSKSKNFKEFFPTIKDALDKIPELSLPLLQQSAPAQKQPKVGRNMPCPCGSGRKFKHCCDS